MSILFFFVNRFCSPKEQPCISHTSREGFLKVNPVFPMAKNVECSQDSAIKSNYLTWVDNLFTCSDVYIMSWASLAQMCILDNSVTSLRISVRAFRQNSLLLVCYTYSRVVY